MYAGRSGRPVFRALLLAVPLAGGAFAQPESGALEACTLITDRAERLDCYDRVAAGGGSAIESGADSETAPAPPQSPEDGVRRAPDASAERSAVGPASAAASASDAGAGVEAAAGVDADTDVDAGAGVDTDTDVEADTGGDAEAEAAVEVAVESLPRSRAERRAGRSDEERAARLSVLVVQRVENLSGLSVFVAEDGTIYDQVSPRQGRYPDLPFIADLESASRNSFWLRTEARGRAIRVVERD